MESRLGERIFKADRKKKMRHGKKLVLGLLAGAACLCLSACGGGDKEPDGSATESTQSEVQQIVTPISGKRVGVSFPTGSEQRWIDEAAYLQEALSAEGCAVTVLYADAAPAGTETTAAAQEEQVQAHQAEDVLGLARGGYDLLLVAPRQDGDLADSLAAAQEAGIPVISYDRLIQGTNAVDYYISFDSYQAGCMQGEYLISSLSLSTEDTSKEHHVEFLAGDPADYRSGYYYNGVYDTLKPYLDAGVLSIPSGREQFSMVALADTGEANAKSAMERILSESYSGGVVLDAVICGTGSEAVGAAAAVQGSYGGKNKVLVTGQGSGEAVLKAISEGKVSMSLAEDTLKEASVAKALICTLLRGDKGDANLISSQEWGFSMRYDTASYDNGSGIVPSYLIAPAAVS